MKKQSGNVPSILHPSSFFNLAKCLGIQVLFQHNANLNHVLIFNRYHYEKWNYMRFQRNITRILLLLLVFCLVISFAYADASAGSPQPDSNVFVLAFKGIISTLGKSGSDPAPVAAEDPAPVTTTPAAPPVTTQVTKEPVEMAYLENVDCSVIDERVATYRCRGNIRIRSGTYDEVQVIAQYADNNTFESGVVSMGGSNITLKSFMLFPDLKYQGEEPAFFVRLDKVRYPVIMYGTEGTAYLNPPPAPVVTRAPVIVHPGKNMPPPATPSADPASGATDRSFSYVLQGESGSVPVTLHTGVYKNQKSLAKLYTCVRYNNDKTPCTQDEARQYYLNYLDETTQVKDLNELVRQIRSRTQDQDDQARIAISLVQRIPYDEAKANALSVTGGQRYPYQTLYDNTGVCSDKSLLLAYLLRELGFSVALFIFPDEKHMAVGIKSPDQYAYRDTGYAFVETTTPSIPTDADGNYSGVIKLTGTLQVIRISDGTSFPGISEEYQDARTFSQFGNGEILSPDKYRVWETLMWKYGMKTGSGKTFGENPTDKPLCGDDGISCNGECYRKCSAGVPQCTTRGLVCNSW